MSRAQFGPIVRYLRRTVERNSLQESPDAQLLERYRQSHDGESFAALFERHAGLVQSVCRRILRHEQDVEDSLQATFLVLAARANSIRNSGSLASWLHGVAHRIAVKAKRVRSRQCQSCGAETPRSDDSPLATAALKEAQAIVDEELLKLPEKYRAPFLLCCLEGNSREEAAHQLGWKLGTVSSRIAEARKRLQARLIRRGVVLSAVLCVIDLTRSRAPAIGPGLANRTTRAALLFCTGQSVLTDLVAVSGVTLARHALLSVSAATKLKVLVAVVLIGGLVTTSVVVARQFAYEGVATLTDASERSAQAGLQPTARTDLHGDPLPENALARLGTLRQRAPDSNIVLSKDGKEIIALSRNMVIRRFDALTGQLHSTSQLPVSGGANGGWLSHSGGFLLYFPSSMSVKSTLDLWDLKSQQVLKKLPMEGGIPTSASFSPDEKQVAIASAGGFRLGQIEVWDLDSGEHRVLWKQEKATDRRYFDPIVIVSPDGKKIAAAHVDMDLRCWDVVSGKQLWEIPDAGSEYFFFGPDSKTIYGMPRHSSSTQTCSWNAETGQAGPGIKQRVHLLAFPVGISPDDRYLAYITGRGELALWEQATNKFSLSLPDPLAYLKPSLFLDFAPRRFVFTADGKALIRHSSTLQRLDLTTGKTVFQETAAWGHIGEVNRVAFSPDGTVIASSSNDQTVRLWDVATGRSLHTFAKGNGDILAFSSDSKHLYVPKGGVDKIICRWVIATGQSDMDFAIIDDNGIRGRTWLNQILVTDDKKRILVMDAGYLFAKTESTLVSHDLSTGKGMSSKKVPWNGSGRLTADGGSVVAFDTDLQKLQTWDVETQKVRLEFSSDRIPDRQYKPMDCDIVLSRTGRLVGSHIRQRPGGRPRADYDDLRIGDQSTGEQLFKIACPNHAVFTFSPDERQLAVATGGRIHFWNTTSWKETGTLTIPNGQERGSAAILSLAYSPDGQRIATGHADSTILLWSTKLK